jgi:hypothetical protein
MVGGSVLTWGFKREGGDSSAVAARLTEGVVQVCGSGTAFAAIKVDGSVATWGLKMEGSKHSNHMSQSASYWPKTRRPLGYLARWPKTHGLLETWLDGPRQQDP